jgi:hypothetical protein
MARTSKEGTGKEKRGKRQPLSKHSFSFGAWCSREGPGLMVAGICLPICVGLIVMAVVATKPEEAAIGNATMVVSALGAVALAAWIVWMFLRHPASVRLYEDGFRWKYFGREYEYAWDEVSELYRSERVLNRTWRFGDLKLVFKDGAVAKFKNSLTGYDRLADTLQQATARALLPEARAALDGEGVDFGPVQLSREGVAVGDELYSFEKMKKIGIVNGHLVCKAGKKEADVLLAKVPNYQLLLTLLGEMGHRPGASR